MACKNPSIPCPCCGTRTKHVTRSGNLQAYCAECQRMKARATQRNYYRQIMTGFSACPPERAAERDTAYDAKPRSDGQRTRFDMSRPPLSAQRQSEIRAMFREMVQALESQARDG